MNLYIGNHSPWILYLLKCRTPLRWLFSKIGQITALTFLGTISIWYQNQNYSLKCIAKHMNFGPECKMRVSVSTLSFGSKAKMSQFSPNIFWTFYQFSVSLPLTFRYSKIIFVPFFRFGKIWAILTRDMVKNWKFSLLL